ncbi:unnamed protein product [Urochloa humidicola]
MEAFVPRRGFRDLGFGGIAETLVQMSNPPALRRAPSLRLAATATPSPFVGRFLRSPPRISMEYFNLQILAACTREVAGFLGKWRLVNTIFKTTWCCTKP